MKELLAELIIAVQSLQQRDLWDYFAIIAPLVLSVIAVWISISTAKKQNKIALFEMRHKVMSVLCFLLTVAREVVDSKKTGIDDWTILATAMDTYKLAETNSAVETDYSRLASFYTCLILEADRASCLFSKKETKQVMNFLELFHGFVYLVCKDEVTTEARDRLNEALLLLEESKNMDDLETYLKL